MPAIGGVPEPAGGWKTGAWYQSRQYWGGTLSEPGQINPLSNQVGAGKAVSTEVLKQTSVAAGLAPEAHETYIEKQRAQQPTQEPKSAEEVTPYLNDYQGNLLSAAAAPPTRIPTTAELKTELQPETGLPELLDRTGQFEELRTTHGVADLEKTLTDLKAQEDELYAGFREQKFTEEGKPVPLSVIAGRIGEEERQYLERKDYIGRQKARVVDELNTKYSLINQLMTFSGLDYNDAVDRYQTEFGNNLKIYDLVADARKEARSEYEYDRDAAKSNLQVYMNAVTSGNLNYGDLSTDDRVMVGKLEAQAGLPVGFISKLKMAPGENIVNINEKTGEALMMNADGNFQVVQTGMTPTPTTGAGAGTAESIRERFLVEAKTIEGRDFNGTWVGEFPLLVQEYAPLMSLEEIYKIYMGSELGKKYGSPSEDPIEIKRIYDRARGQEED